MKKSGASHYVAGVVFDLATGDERCMEERDDPIQKFAPAHLHSVERLGAMQIKNESLASEGNE